MIHLHWVFNAVSNLYSKLTAAPRRGLCNINLAQKFVIGAPMLLLLIYEVLTEDRFYCIMQTKNSQILVIGSRSLT